MMGVTMRAPPAYSLMRFLLCSQFSMGRDWKKLSCNFGMKLYRVVDSMLSYARDEVSAMVAVSPGMWRYVRLVRSDNDARMRFHRLREGFLDRLCWLPRTAGRRTACYPAPTSYGGAR